jgi:hypothetical protein
MDNKMPRTIDADTGKRYDITVTEGPYSSTRRITFGASFSITLTAEDARRLVDALQLGGH